MITAWYIFLFPILLASLPVPFSASRRHDCFPILSCDQALSFRDFRLHLPDQLGQLFLTFGVRTVIDTAGVLLSSGHFGGYFPSQRWSLSCVTQPVPDLRILPL